MNKNNGCLVKHEDGRVGRTYQSSQTVSGKCFVYWSKSELSNSGIPTDYEEKAVIVSQDKLTLIGYID
jgi:hypothetical protein